MNLFYRTHGEGPPLIILHGLFGSADNWIPIAKRLENIRKVYMVDQRNHGQSPHHPNFNYDCMLDDLYTFIEQHNLDTPDILGHSMGGKVAMNFAVKYPDDLAKLIVVDIGPKFYPIHHDVLLEGLKDIDIKKINSREKADAELADYVESITIRKFLLKNLKRTAVGYDWKMNLDVIYDQIANVGEGLKSIDRFNHDTLFIRGGMSNYILDEDLNAIKVHFPKYALETIPETSHWVHSEKPEELSDILNNFLLSK
jgi:pimeloyl-ACP methyl ester carboxylesterase